MSDKGYDIEISLTEGYQVSERLYNALTALANAVAEEAGDEVTGFQYKADPSQTGPVLDIGLGRGGAGKYGPVVESWCIGYSFDYETGDTSCLANFN